MKKKIESRVTEEQESVVEPVEETASMMAESQFLWYLGIDIGTTGFSAVLLNEARRCFYPLYYWESPTHRPLSLAESRTLISATQTDATAKKPVYYKQFRFAWGLNPQRLNAQSLYPNPQFESQNLGLLQFQSGQINLKSCLPVSLPHCTEDQNWEPQFQGLEDQGIPLASTLRRGSEAIAQWLGTKLNSSQSALELPTMKAYSISEGFIEAEGLSTETLAMAIANLKGVIVGVPTHFPDSYRFNLREMLLEANLIAQASQCVFVEEAIATVLSEMRDTAAGAQWRGQTLAINSGAMNTDLVLVNLPNQRQMLSHSDFKIRSFAYAGMAIDQDIVCQLLLTEEYSQLKSQLFDGEIEFPTPGEPDLQRRYPLQQALSASELGQTLLQAARYLKQILQHQDQFMLEIQGYHWAVKRKALEIQVLLPFLRRLNRELNALLSETKVETQGINQALCTGGTAAMGAIARWLRQKLPSAAIIQDHYPLDRPPACSRVASGSATLPLFPQVLDLPRQQYSDYFILSELIQAVPESALPVGTILQLLERQGINTRACKQQIFSILEGRLPLGLIPTGPDLELLTPKSRKNADYEAIAATPLFTKTDLKTYQLNKTQGERILQYLKGVTATTFQTLEDPYIVEIGTP